MKPRLTALALGVCASLPASALADEVRAMIDGVSVPVGPEGTSVVRVERAVAAGTRYAIVRARVPGDPSRCGVAAERVSAWARVDGRWVEAMSEAFDRCPADHRRGITLTVRARVVERTEGPVGATELHVRLLDPRLPAATAPITRFRRVGDRFVSPRGDAPLAAAPGAPSGTLRAVGGAVDGRADEWQGVAPFAELRGSQSQRADVWLGARGSTLRFAARVEGLDGAPPVLTLRLAEPGVSTARLRGRSGNAGRVLTVRCEGDGPAADATVRCAREGGALFIEGETELASMLWSRDEVDAVSALAEVSWGPGRTAGAASPRLRAMALPVPFRVMEGASTEALVACRGGYRGRVSESAGIGVMSGMITCGARCEGGVCERIFGSIGASTRLTWVPPVLPGEGMCMGVTGAGAAALNACRGEGADHVRLVGQIPARGFDLVVAVERTRRVDGVRRPEVWTLVTRSARWHRLWAGAPSPSEAPRLARVSLVGQHPALCHDDTRCERVESLTFTPAGDPGATAALAPRAPRWN